MVFDACNIYPHQAWTSENDREGLRFLQNIMHIEKYSNINLQNGGFQLNGAGSQL